MSDFSRPAVESDGKTLNLSGICDYTLCENVVHVHNTDEYMDVVCGICFKKYCPEHILESGEVLYTFCTFENGGGDFPIFICGECIPSIEEYDIHFPFR